MNWIMLVLQIIKRLPELLQVAEKAFDDVPDSGAQKKEMVMTTVRAIVSAVIGDVFWEKIEGIATALIDILCSFIFPNDKNK
jgi:hypothetical protein